MELNPGIDTPITNEQSSISVWEGFYDSYSPVMFGIICNLTNDETIAQEILVTAFTLLKERQVHLKAPHTLYPILLKHTYLVAIAALKGKIVINPEAGNLVLFLCNHRCTVKEAAYVLTISEIEATFLLRKGLNAFRNKEALIIPVEVLPLVA